MRVNIGFWPFAVIYSFFNLLMAAVYLKVHNRNYIVNFFYYGDILLNALGGGNPKVTVSARTGYNAVLVREGLLGHSWYWLTAEKIIDCAFLPIDGMGHCYKAYESTVRKQPFINIHQGPAWIYAPWLGVIVIACLILIPVNRVLGLLVRAD